MICVPGITSAFSWRRVSCTAGAGPVSLTAYGRIPSTATSVPAGDYNDTVTVTVTF